MEPLGFQLRLLTKTLFSQRKLPSVGILSCFSTVSWLFHFLAGHSLFQYLLSCCLSQQALGLCSLASEEEQIPLCWAELGLIKGRAVFSAEF